MRLIALAFIFAQIHGPAKSDAQGVMEFTEREEGRFKRDG
jgi:hypothetical protein